MISKIQRYFLEIKDFTKLIELNLHKSYKIILNEKKDFQLNKFFYKQIGIDHYWRDRLIWPDKEWKEDVQNPNFETWFIKKDEELIGYYEQEFHPKNQEVELINMGVLKEFRGRKIGSNLLIHAINRASQKKPKRMWVHTCSLDHEFALKNYKAKGFKIFKEEEIDFVA